MSRREHRPRVYSAIARRLAERCAALEAAGHAADDAERIALEEALANDASYVPELYELLVAAHAPARRREHGVYTTPLPVVDAQVRMIAEVLRRLGCDNDFADPRVLVVDPATGSGAYPLSVLRHCALTSRPRMLLYEALAGPTAVARAAGLDVIQRDALGEDNLPEAPIMVCLGNPPYRRRRATHLLRDLIGSDGIHAKNLHNDYVYFWRWALERVFASRDGPGIVSFVTASSYLRGPAFGGMRERLRTVLDELWIVDLEGDHLAARRSDNVFPIRTPVAIATAVRLGGSRTGAARVRYQRITGERSAKLHTLARLSLANSTWQEVQGTRAAPLIASRRTPYADWPLLTDLFPWQTSGVQMKRTWPIAPTPDLLRARWTALLASNDRGVAFGPTRDRSIRSTPPALKEPRERLPAIYDLPVETAPFEPRPYAYRSFDRQWVLPDARLGDYMRASLWRVAGPRQVFLTSLLTNVLGAGPAAVAAALVPDMDCFRGSFGARAVIPLWRDAHATVPNIADGLLEALTCSPETLLAYCYALLGGRGYVRRFAEELRTPGPRVPLTRDTAIFQRAAELGQQLLDVHTFRCTAPGDAHEVRAIGEAMPTTFGHHSDLLRVGGGVIAPIRPAVWAYSVSGMPVVRSWLRRRITPRAARSALDAIALTRWTPQLTSELLELIWLVEATLRLEPQLDAMLEAVVRSSGERGAPWSAAEQHALN